MMIRLSRWARRRPLPPRNERGATATEYGLLAGFIAIAIVGAVTAFGDALLAFWAQFLPAVESLVSVF